MAMRGVGASPSGVEATGGRIRVAIVGTGIAGLSCAYLLSSNGKQYEVTLFEREAELGMDSQAVMVENAGAMVRVNTPPRAFSKGYYPNLFELYRQAGVEVQDWSWAYNYCIFGAPAPFMRVGNWRVGGYRLPSFANWRQWLQLLTPSSFRLVRDFFHFHYCIRKDMWDSELQQMTLREYLDHLGLSEAFVYKGLLPILSMICTCTYEACLNYPVELIMHYYYSNSTFGQYRTKHGTRDAVTRLSAKVEHVVTGATVQSVRKLPAGQVRITFRKSNGQTDSREFDQVVLATQANHSLQMVEDLSDETKKILSCIEHEKSEVVIHKDEVVMPRRKIDWSPMNAMVSPDNDASMFTIWMNDSFKSLTFNMFQTWNPIVKIDDEKVFKRIIFERPIVTAKSLDAINKLQNVNGKDGIWYCGAWTAHRIPLQESGVVSALAVFNSLTGEKPKGNFVDAHSHLYVIDSSASPELEAKSLKPGFPKVLTFATSLGIVLMLSAFTRRGVAL